MCARFWGTRRMWRWGERMTLDCSGRAGNEGRACAGLRVNAVLGLGCEGEELSWGPSRREEKGQCKEVMQIYAKTMQMSQLVARGKRTQPVILFPKCGPEPPVTESPRKLIQIPRHPQTCCFHLGAAAQEPTCSRSFPGDYLLPHSFIEHAHGNAL